MSVETFAEPVRDRWGRPMVVPPGGGKPVAYTRCTTYVDVLDDKYNLQKWMQRMVAVGLSTRPDLNVAAASLASDPEGNKQALDDVCEQAVEAAKGSAKATIGTALHAFVERINLGLDPGIIPAEFQHHVDNYRSAATAAGFAPVHVERFTVCDELQVGGTPDLITRMHGTDKLIVADLKTGPSTLKYGSLKVAMQMAVYAHSKLYDTNTGARIDLGDINTDWGVVVALDSDTGDCTLHRVDLAAGWQAVQLATQVRAWRRRKDLLADLDLTPITSTPSGSAQLLEAIASSTSRQALEELWAHAGEAWGDAHTAAAKQRLTELAA